MRAVVADRVRPAVPFLTALALLAFAAGAAAAPIVDTGVPSLPAFSGAQTTGHKIKDPTIPPQNPYLAKNPLSNVHNDTWMTDAYTGPGPLGSNLVSASASKPPAVCVSMLFDTRGRIVTVCPSSIAPPQVRIIDAGTLATIATYDLPQAADPPGTKAYQNFAGGGYFFLDGSDRVWVATKTNHIFAIGQSADGQQLVKKRDFDLTGVLDASTERITSALPDFSGRIWFVSKENGKVGTINRKTGAIKVIKLNEEIENSFAVAKDGVYIVSDKSMYRFKAAINGAPVIVWKSRYRNSGIVKPGQVNAGSGTTPTIMDNNYVAITDNADPMNVVVYRRQVKLHGAKRKVCTQPVFSPGRGATENSLITAGRSLIVENNYGYQDPLGPNAGTVTQPGFARVDVNANGRGCHRVWTNHDARAPTVVPKLSTRTGLIYTYTRPSDAAAEGYYWTAIDWRNGKTAWSRYAGSGIGFNNNYSGLTLGPDGTAYLGTIGGIVTLRDGP